MIITGIIIALFGIALVLLSRSITTFFHEMGHAIPALYFTEEPVVVYVGSYGDISKSLKLEYGRLTLYLTFNVFGWNLGMCTHKPIHDTQKTMIIIMGGPLASLIISLCLIYAIANYGLDEGTIFILSIFVASTIWDFFVNIYPSSSPMNLHDGSIAYSDGAQLLGLYQERKYPESYFKGVKYYQENNLDQALEEWNKTVEAGYKNDGVLDLILTVHLKKEDYHAAREHVDEHYYNRQLSATEYAILGDIHLGINDYREAITFYNQSLYLNYRAPFVLHSRGKAHMQLGEYDEALEDFQRTTYYSPGFAEAFSNRGAVKIQLGYLEDGYTDLMHALSVEEDLPIAHLYLGIYYDKRANYEAALVHFEKAKALGAEHHGLEFYIAETKRQL